MKFSSDVEAILAKHARPDRYEEDDHRSTRVEIIEEAVRLWALQGGGDLAATGERLYAPAVERTTAQPVVDKYDYQLD